MKIITRDVPPRAAWALEQAGLHPLLAKNRGHWRYHDRPRPGVLHHVAHGGDEVWTVRAGTQRQMDVYTIRTLVGPRREPYMR